VGRNANITNVAATNATAIGANTTANFANSTAIGTGATTTAANQVAIGGAGSTVRFGGYTTAGVLVNDVNGNVTTNTTLLGTVATNTANIATNTANITTLQGQVGTLNTTVASQGNSILALQGQTASLFNLSDINRRDIRKANEGVAMALAMDTPFLPSEANFAVSGGVGYFRDRLSGSASFAARVGPMTSFTGGVGVGFESGSVGARAGFQHAW
jgi:hypothetical protein